MKQTFAAKLQTTAIHLEAVKVLRDFCGFAAVEKNNTTVRFEAGQARSGPALLALHGSSRVCVGLSHR